MANSTYPKARENDLVVQNLADEVLIYDLAANEAHCLNTTAAFVWSRCSGEASVADIARLIEKEFGHPVDENFVRLALSQLADKNLVADGDTPHFSRTTRREIIKRIGLATVVAVPVIASLVAPKNAFSATSCVCANPAQCISCPSTPNCNIQGICAP